MTETASSDKLIVLQNEKYAKLLAFVRELADESVYKKFDNLNHVKWDAYELLQEIEG